MTFEWVQRKDDGKSLPDRMNSICKGPEVGESMAHSKDSEKTITEDQDQAM